MSSAVDSLRALYRHFSDMQVWPLPAQMDIEGWLRNFETSDQQLAAILAQELLHYSERHCDALLADAFRRISTLLIEREAGANRRIVWNNFLDRMAVVPVVGRVRGAESGYLMAYRVRQVLGVPDRQLIAHENALDRLRYLENRPVVFVDDTVITGDQFIEFADTKRILPGGAEVSYADLLDRHAGDTFLSCMIASTFGVRRLQERFPRLRISAGATFDSTFCLGNAECNIFSSAVMAEMRELITAASIRAGIPAVGRINHYGYNGVGLLLSLHHNVPDSSLPILWWKENGWRPLIVRG